jgi:hypothetical protein
MQPTKLKNITFEWDEKNKELLLTRDKFVFSVPFKNLYSLRVFVARIYRHYMGPGIKAKKHGKNI